MSSRLFAIFDRDGTLIVERNYLSQPTEVELIPGVTRGLQELRRMGLGVIVITNQSGIGRGYFDEQTLAAIHQQMSNLLAADGALLEGIYYCPHTPGDDCLCRKPRTGLIELAAAEHGFDPTQSFVIGDKACDIELGQNVGATTILVQTGYGQETASTKTVNPDHVANDVAEAASLIQNLLTSAVPIEPLEVIHSHAPANDLGRTQ